MRAFMVMPGWYVVVWKNRVDTNMTTYHNAMLQASSPSDAINTVIERELAK